MMVQKFRWSKVYESSEEELTEFLAVRNIVAERWAIDEFEQRDSRRIDHDATLWCAEGSLTLHIDGKARSIQPGDGIRIPANMPFEITAGMSGCVCYEAAISTNIQ